VLKRRLKDASRVRISLATAIGNPNHIALARLTRHAGGDVKALTIDVFDSARYAIAHLIDGKGRSWRYHGSERGAGADRRHAAHRHAVGA